MELFYYVVFGGLSAVVAALELSQNNKDRIITSPAFNSFRNNYLVVYSLMMAGDWLQGPYVYYLYRRTGIRKATLGSFSLLDLASSMLFGTIVGSLADKQGSERGMRHLLHYYILSCVTKHLRNIRF
ncbi:unnamed protein product [Rhodiola kirilowii]